MWRYWRRSPQIDITWLVFPIWRYGPTSTCLLMFWESLRFLWALGEIRGHQTPSNDLFPQLIGILLYLFFQFLSFQHNFPFFLTFASQFFTHLSLFEYFCLFSFDIRFRSFVEEVLLMLTFWRLVFLLLHHLISKISFVFFIIDIASMRIFHFNFNLFLYKIVLGIELNNK